MAGGRRDEIVVAWDERRPVMPEAEPDSLLRHFPSKTGVTALDVPSKTGVTALDVPSKTGVTALDGTSKTGVNALVGIERLVRSLPIRWRVRSIAALNTVVVVIIAVLISDGAKVRTTAWGEFRQVRESDQLLALIGGEAGRLQDLIHRYIYQPNPEIFGEILLRREALLSTLRSRASADPVLAGSVDDLAAVTERFLAGFNDLRAAQAEIARTYVSDVLGPARQIAADLTGIEAGTGGRAASRLQLAKAHEAFTAALVAANSYYLSPAAATAAEARSALATIAAAVPPMLASTESDGEREALDRLREHAAAFESGFATLAANFATRTRLLHDEIDGSQATMVATIDGLSAQMRQREQQARDRFDKALADVSQKVTVVVLLFASVIILAGVAVGRSISRPLRELKASMNAIASGNYDWRVSGIKARDEIGEMARTIEVFRENAIAKQRVENELRAAKDRAEKTLADLRNAQQSLIEAEKLAALGGLVAGVAHEVNNPVGISLTVASSFAHRCDVFHSEVKAGPLRRSRLEEFIAGSRDAAYQLVANLYRAAELIQSFKQVAVDRSHAERRAFNLRQSTEQIVASLRPSLKKLPLTIAVEIPDDIIVDSYPGTYGQVLTNLILNSVTHGFPNGRTGTITVRARRVAPDQIEVICADDGAGMTEEIQRRAFDPFFTTRRGHGGTGLGLHIVYNLVTNRLGGRVALSSSPGEGTTFRMTLPLDAPHIESEELPEQAATAAGTAAVPPQPPTG
jgi:signal transduction histidine kinase